MSAYKWTTMAGAMALGLCLGCSSSEAPDVDASSIDDLDDVEVPTPEAAADLASAQITDANFDAEYEKLLRDIEADEAAPGGK